MLYYNQHEGVFILGKYLKEDIMKDIFKSIGRYFKGVKKETERIRWTSGKDLIKYSLTTVFFMLFLGLYFYVIDILITLLRSRV